MAIFLLAGNSIDYEGNSGKRFIESHMGSDSTFLVKVQIQSSDRETPSIGTGRYTAFEIPISQKVDVYRFWVTYCVILTGKSPFEDDRHQGLSLYDRRRPLDNLILREAPKALSLHARRPLDTLILRDDVPEAVKKLIHQCLDSILALRPTFDHIVRKLRKCKPVQAHEDSIRIN